MHICFSTIDYHGKKSGGGIASYLDALTPELVKLGHKVTIVGPGEKQNLCVKQGVQIIQLPLGARHWYAYRLGMPSWIYLPWREWEWSNSLYQAISKLHKEQPIDILESQEAGLWRFMKNKDADSPPIVVRLHGSSYIFKKYSGASITKGEKYIQQLELQLLKKVKGITAPGLFQCREYQKEVRQEIVHIPNPVGHALLKAASEKKKVKREPFTLLYTGRIQYVKGTLVLLEALGKIRLKYPNVRLTIAGGLHNSISQSLLDEKIREFGIRKNLELLGHVPYEQLPKLYRQASVFVMPSYYETFGISVVEAMAFGLPVIATKAGALPELVKHEKTGLLVSPGDINALAESIMRLLSNETLRKKLGKEGQQLVQNQYVPEKVAAQTIEYYKKLLFY